MFRVLAINPGATSTKIAVFDEDRLILKSTFEHQGEDLKPYDSLMTQLPYRLSLIERFLEDNGIAIESLSATVGRGGLLKPIPGGTYRVDDALLSDLESARFGTHASNLGAPLAHAFAERTGIPSFVVDPVVTDEMEPVARLSGLPELPRLSRSHALNCKAVARRVSSDLGKRYDELNLIVVHLGTGISVTAHRNGRMIDVNDATSEGPFSPDRCGGLPTLALTDLCFSGGYTRKELLRRISGEGGMYAYLGTRDAREAEKRAADGDGTAGLVLQAMAYQTAKEIGAMATVLRGDIDRIVITGGLARSEILVRDIVDRVSFLAQVVLHPGEEDLESLAAGAFRVLRGEEEARGY
jgi:butyrate kinase